MGPPYHLADLSGLPGLSARLLPYLPWIAAALTINAVGVLEGYLLRAWMGRAQPTSFVLAGKLFVAGPLLVVYLLSLVWGMIQPTYSIPYALHVMIALVVATLFPQKFFRVGPNGFEFGVRDAEPKEKGREGNPPGPTSTPSA